MRIKPTSCILFTNTFIYYISLVWKKSWKSKTRVFNASINEYIVRIFKIQTPPQISQHRLFWNIFWNPRCHASDLSFTSKWSSHPFQRKLLSRFEEYFFLCVMIVLPNCGCIYKREPLKFIVEGLEGCLMKLTLNMFTKTSFCKW